MEYYLNAISYRRNENVFYKNYLNFQTTPNRRSNFNRISANFPNFQQIFTYL